MAKSAAGQGLDPSGVADLLFHLDLTWFQSHQDRKRQVSAELEPSALPSGRIFAGVLGTLPGFTDRAHRIDRNLHAGSDPHRGNCGNLTTGEGG